MYQVRINGLNNERGELREGWRNLTALAVMGDGGELLKLMARVGVTIERRGDGALSRADILAIRSQHSETVKDIEAGFRPVYEFIYPLQRLYMPPEELIALYESIKTVAVLMDCSKNLWLARLADNPAYMYIDIACCYMEIDEEMTDTLADRADEALLLMDKCKLPDIYSKLAGFIGSTTD